MIWIILHIIEIFFWLLLAASGAYILFFALVSMLWKRPISPLSAYLEGQIRSMREPRQFTFLVLYPAYNEDRVIVNSVHTFLGQYYPYKGFHVAVSKAKAMQYALQQIQGEYDYVVILDADNVVESDFLAKLNEVCNKGYDAIQCHRCAKNSNNDIAVLDGVSEEINNTLFRKAHNRIGLSSALIGSGMCFRYKWFKKNVYKLSTAGEDRELEALLLRQRIHIHYEPDIHVYDEKVSNKDNFQKQRLRWMTAQIQSLFSLLPYLPQALMEGNIDYIDKTFQQALIPRSMLVVGAFGMALVMTLFSLIFSLTWYIKWWLLFLFICLSLYVSTPKQLRSHSVFGKILSLPKLVWKMVMNILKIDRKNTDFIHTTHDSQEEKIKK